MIKLFVSDLDGTLLHEEKYVEQHNADALSELQRQGVEVCLASGRMDTEILKISTDINNTFHRISQNGGFVWTKENQELHGKVFEDDLAVKLYKKMIDPNRITLVCSNDTNYVEQRNEIIEALETHMFFPIEEQIKMTDSFGHALSPSKITVLGDHDEMVALQKEVNEEFGDYIDTYISAKQCLDIMPKHISKGNAIEILLNHLQLKPEEIACVGDSFNDIPMFQLTPNSFAMATAPEAVQRHASAVVSSVSEAARIVLEKNKQTT
ncbi:HAD family hydrolase [Priestia aryabhattai]|uniref:HAD family hydrolase n=1 Tax=Priestia aryabhattai TaxID=412384 RepID=UPI00203BD069|nr:HAD family hydrolase [Priestia aryabhattai]MCM3253774.1 HAD family hydrolase [Priestia aryabhattai]